MAMYAFLEQKYFFVVVYFVIFLRIKSQFLEEEKNHFILASCAAQLY